LPGDLVISGPAYHNVYLPPGPLGLTMKWGQIPQSEYRNGRPHDWYGAGGPGSFPHPDPIKRAELEDFDKWTKTHAYEQLLARYEKEKLAREKVS
jgi:hypothetical protein